MSDLMKAFDQAMLEIYKRAKSEAGYTPSEFFRMLSDHGGYETARRLIRASTISSGYVRLYELQRLDLTVEAVIIENLKWHELFSDEELEICRNRLREYGYNFT